MRFECDAPMVADSYGHVTRTYHLVAVIHPAEHDVGLEQYTEVIAAYLYDKPEPMVGDKPGSVDILEDLSDDTVNELTRIADEYEPPKDDPTHDREVADDLARDVVLNVRTPERDREIADGSDD